MNKKVNFPTKKYFSKRFVFLTETITLTYFYLKGYAICEQYKTIGK